MRQAADDDDWATFVTLMDGNKGAFSSRDEQVLRALNAQKPEHNRYREYISKIIGLIIIDGFVIAPDTLEIGAESLLDEYYEIEEEIKELKAQNVKRGLFGGLNEHDTQGQCLRPLVLMSRLCEIKQVLQGRLDIDSIEADKNDHATVQTVGDYIEVLLQYGIPDLFIPNA